MSLLVTLTTEQVYDLMVQAARVVAEERWLPGPEIAEAIGCSIKTWRTLAADPGLVRLALNLGTSRRPILRWRLYDVQIYLRGAR